MEASLWKMSRRNSEQAHSGSTRLAGMASTSAANLFNVKGMVFVVTGAGSGNVHTLKLLHCTILMKGIGIGLMMAQALAANGAAKVFILGRRLEKLQEAAKSGV